ncbi:HAD hydrolase family protein [Streptomyces sp. NPDC005202]|uniref:HAD hydrolase family protein n=1 Tax=Streptomyces sp. NPDC005202 TaxID=3157021 RepID=UPI0033B7A961
MVATDLDGTLLRDDGTLSARTPAAQRTAAEPDAVVVLVTARPPHYVDALAAATGLAGTAVCGNSAPVYDIRGRMATAHAQGVSHAGLSSAAVLLGTNGPQLSCFGAVRAAAPDGEQRTGLAGLDPSCLAPEQAQGGRPRPLGDVFALGAVLSYASTGYTIPEQNELPASLRGPITACLSRDPLKRPSASELAAELTPPLRDPAGLSAEASEKWHPATPALTVLDASATPTPTVLDGSATPSGPGTRLPLPLPAGIVTAVARQSAQVLAAQLPQRLTAVS